MKLMIKRIIVGLTLGVTTGVNVGAPLFEKSLQYNSDGKVVTETSFSSYGETKGTLHKVLQKAYDYDLLGNVLQQTRTVYQGGQSQRVEGDYYIYNAIGKVIEQQRLVIDPITTVQSLHRYVFEYDPNGNVISTQKLIEQNGAVIWRGKVTHRQYDHMNQLTDQLYQNDQGVWIDLHQDYDAVLNKVSAICMAEVSDYNTPIANCDAANVTSYYGNKEVIRYHYYPNGLIESLSYPDGKTMHWDYYPDGRAASVTDYAGVTTTYEYYLDPSVAYNLNFPEFCKNLLWMSCKPKFIPIS